VIQAYCMTTVLQFIRCTIVSILTLLVGHPACRKLSDEVLAWLRYDTRCYFNVRSKADISQLNLPHRTEIYRSLEQGTDCLHTVQLMPLYPKTSSRLASFKSRLVLPFWYRLTHVILEKRPLNGCSGSSTIVSNEWFMLLSGSVPQTLAQ